MVPDLRGFGDSELDGALFASPIWPTTSPGCSTIWASIARWWAASPWVATSSLAFAARHARRLLGLVLADTKAGADTPEARAGRDEAMALVRAQGVAAYVEAQLPRLLGPERLGRMQATRCATSARRARRRCWPRSRPCATAPTGGPSWPRSPAPPWSWWAPRTPSLRPAEAAAMATAIPRAVLVEIPGAGHLSNLEAPQPFSQAIAGFLGRDHSA